MNYEVKPIDYQDCKEWFMKKHYAHRMPPVEFCFGLYQQQNLCGVCSYGTPVSSTLRNCIKGYKLYELNRLVINENMPKNTLSWFVSKTIKMMPLPCVLVSYADTSQGHHGYIYQATNWIYTGLSIPFKDYFIEGLENMHHTTLHDLSRGKENRTEWLKDKFGDKLKIVERARKHRYFYFNGNKYDKKNMISLLTYEIQPYPKGDNKRYDASYQPTTQIKLI